MRLFPFGKNSECMSVWNLSKLTMPLNFLVSSNRKEIKGACRKGKRLRVQVYLEPSSTNAATHPLPLAALPSADVLCCVAVCYSELQCVVVCAAVALLCCSVLPCVAMRCSLLQCVAVCRSVLQCVAVCCSVLQCVAHCNASFRPHTL